MKQIDKEKTILLSRDIENLILLDVLIDRYKVHGRRSVVLQFHKHLKIYNSMSLISLEYMSDKSLTIFIRRDCIFQMI